MKPSDRFLLIPALLVLVQLPGLHLLDLICQAAEPLGDRERAGNHLIHDITTMWYAEPILVGEPRRLRIRFVGMKTWQTWISILVVAVGTFGVLVYGHRSAAWTVNQIIGMAIIVPALGLWMLALVQPGKSFAISAQAKELVTHGLYSKIQNPIYVFGAIVLVGLIIYSSQLQLFLMFLIVIPVQWIRIRNERQALDAKFGEAYREYRRRTWF